MGAESVRIGDPPDDDHHTIGLLGSALAIGTRPLFAILADRIGRKPRLHHRGLIAAAATFVFFAALSSAAAPVAVIGSVLMISIGYAMCNAVAPAGPDAVRAAPPRRRGGRRICSNWPYTVPQGDGILGAPHSGDHPLVFGTSAVASPTGTTCSRPPRTPERLANRSGALGPISRTPGIPDGLRSPRRPCAPWFSTPNPPSSGIRTQ